MNDNFLLKAFKGIQKRIRSTLQKNTLLNLHKCVNKSEAI